MRSHEQQINRFSRYIVVKAVYSVCRMQHRDTPRPSGMRVHPTATTTVTMLAFPWAVTSSKAM